MEDSTTDMETLLHREVDKLKKKSFSELATLADRNEVLTPELMSYQIEIQVFWDDKKKKHVRVVGFIDEDIPKKWWRNFISRSGYGFIVDSSGKFIDE